MSNSKSMCNFACHLYNNNSYYTHRQSSKQSSCWLAVNIAKLPKCFSCLNLRLVSVTINFNTSVLDRRLQIEYADAFRFFKQLVELFVQLLIWHRQDFLAIVCFYYSLDLNTIGFVLLSFYSSFAILLVCCNIVHWNFYSTQHWPISYC